jgi:hypothetical protein
VRRELLDLASDLARRGEPFALATVVARKPPISAQVGDRGRDAEMGDRPYRDAVTASFVLVLALSVRRRDVFTPVVSGAGMILVLVGRLALGLTALTAVGAALLVTAAVVNSVRCRRAETAPG